MRKLTMMQNCLTVVSQSSFDLIGEMPDMTIYSVCTNTDLPYFASTVPAHAFVFAVFFGASEIPWSIHLVFTSSDNPEIFSPVVQSVPVYVINHQWSFWKVHQKPVQNQVAFSELFRLRLSQACTGIPSFNSGPPLNCVPFETTGQREVIVVNESNETTRKENFLHP